MLFLKNQSIQFLKALRIKQLQDFCFLKYIMGLKNCGTAVINPTPPGGSTSPRKVETGCARWVSRRQTTNWYKKPFA